MCLALSLVDSRVHYPAVTRPPFRPGWSLLRRISGPGVIHRWSNRVSGLCLITPRIVQVRDKKIVPENATLFAEPGFREYLTPEEEWMTDYLLDSPFESPTLIITGRQDRVTGYQDAWDLIENIPRATFAVLDRASHFLSYCRALP